MKVGALLAMTAAVLVTFPGARGESGSGQPGYCDDDEDCNKDTSGYVCVSVQTTREGIEDVKQCLPYNQTGDVCSGTSPGLCPSFSTWDTDFQSISAICAYFVPDSGTNCLTSSFSGSDTDGYVECLSVTEGSGSSAETLGVLYGCVDYDGSNLLFEEDSDSWTLANELNMSGIVDAGCMNPTDNDVVCSGRGTCAPTSANSLSYGCECNVGYNGTYCQKVVSNACTTEAQCAAGTCNLTTKQCECEAGTTGDQCAYCDPSSSKACNGHGTCVAGSASASDESAAGTVTAAGSGSDATSTSEATVGSESGSESSGNVCECDSGWAGDQCTRKSDSTSSKSSTSSKTSSGSTGSNSASSVMTSLAVLATSAFVAVALN